MDGNLRPLFREHLKKYHWQSIETGGTGSGTPDANYCVDGVEGWIEFKIARSNAVGLRPAQVAWIDRRYRCGGNVLIAVRYSPVNKTKEPGLYIFHSSSIWALKDEGLKIHLHGSGLFFPGGPSKWPWTAIDAALRDPKGVGKSRRDSRDNSTA